MTEGAHARHGSKKENRASEFVSFAGSTVLYQGARFAFSLAAARSLSPSDFTAWALIVAMLAYAPAILMGVNNGMARELPILAGRGSNAAVGRVMDAAWATAAIALVVIVVLLAALAFATSIAVRDILVIGFLFGGTIIFSLQQFVLRSRLRFGAASGQLALFGLAGLVASAWLVLMPDAGLNTAATLYAAPLSGGILLGLVVEPPVVGAGADPAVARRLAAIGFPIMLAGLVFSLFVTLDRWIAVALLGVSGAAPYTLASLVAAAMLVVPTVVSQQTYPRMAIARGQGATAEQLFAMAHRQGVIAASLVLPVAGFIVAFALVGIPVLLPAYTDATGAVVSLSFGFTGLAFLTGYGNYLNVVGAQWRYLAVQGTSATAAIPLMILGGFLFGITGIALGMATSHLVYGALIYAVARRTRIIEGLP